MKYDKAVVVDVRAEPTNRMRVKQVQYVEKRKTFFFRKEKEVEVGEPVSILQQLWSVKKKFDDGQFEVFSEWRDITVIPVFELRKK